MLLRAPGPNTSAASLGGKAPHPETFPSVDLLCVQHLRPRKARDGRFLFGGLTPQSHPEAHWMGTAGACSRRARIPIQASFGLPVCGGPGGASLTPELLPRGLIKEGHI